MRYRAIHVTRFQYSGPVSLDPLTIRLRPRSDCWQRLERYRIQLDPRPSTLVETIDAEGNDVAHAWFSGKTESLQVRTEFEVETLRGNPFDYLVLDRSALRLPFEYARDLQAQLGPAVTSARTDDRAVREFVRRVIDETKGQTLPILTRLNDEICRLHEYGIRREGDPRPAAQTLRVRTGACRDLAVLFMECCRRAGLASRFVSGYTEEVPEASEQHMHAWAEVFLPGGGWRGYDPSQGLAVSDRHIAVAASAVPRLAAPTSGTFRGAATALKLEAEIRVEGVVAAIGRGMAG